MDSFGQHQGANNRASPLTSVLINTFDEFVKLTESCERYTCILNTYNCLHESSQLKANSISSDPLVINDESRRDHQEKAEPNNKVPLDQATLRNLDALLTILSTLNEVADYLKLLPILLVSKLFRCIHTLSGDYSMDTQEESVLLSKCWHYVLFIPLMDLLFCLIRLERVMAAMLQVNSSLKVLKSVSSIVVDYPIGKKNEENRKLNQLSREKLPKLFEKVDNIQSEMFSNQTIFDRFLTNFRNLVQDHTSNPLQDNATMALTRAFESFLSCYTTELIDTTTSVSNTKPTNYVISNLVPNRFMTTPSRRLLGSTLVFLTYCRTFEKPLNSVIKIMMNTLHKFNSMNLVYLEKSNLIISIGQLLAQHLPKHIQSSNSKTIRMLSSQVSEGVKCLNKCEHFICQTLSWQMQFKTLFFDGWKSNSTTETRILTERQISNLKSGIKLANNINEAIGSYLVSCNHFGVVNMQLFQQIALIKSIGACLVSAKLNVVRALKLKTQLIRQELDNLTSNLKDRLMSLSSTIILTHQKDYSSNTLFTASILASRLSSEDQTAPSLEQIFSLVELIQILCPEDLVRLEKALYLMTNDIEVEFERATTCSYMFWCLPHLGSFYRWAFEEDPCAINELHYVHMALDDMEKLFVWHEQDDDIGGLNELPVERDEFFASLRKELMNQLRSNFLDRISQELETELRLQVHRKLQLPDSHNSFNRHVYNLKHIFKLTDFDCEFRLLGEQVSLRGHVEEYLNRIFFELTTITPQDWSTYDSMIHLARRKYGLHLAELEELSSTGSCLEGASGLDLYDVARNLGSFAANYAYDHPLRRFIEKWPAASNRWSGGGCSSVSSSHQQLLELDITSASVNVLQLEHVHRFIQTHGLGSASGLVNRCYQLIKKLLGLFSRQMSDERLVPALAKEEAAFQKDNVINFERATALTNLFTGSSSSSGQAAHTRLITNHVKALRVSVTQLGNVLAFVSLLRMGTLRCAASNLGHLPDQLSASVTNSCGFLDVFSNTEVSDEAVRASTGQLQECLANLKHQFSPTNDHLSSMVHLFAASLQQQQAHHHLSSFFLLVPSLCIDYVNHLTGCRDRLEARAGPTRVGAQLSDDGFPLGVAFLLVALNQRRHFARMQWFEHTSQRMRRDRLQLEERAHNSAGRDESLKQTALMSLRRINRLSGEYEALGYTLAAALSSFSVSASALACASGSESTPAPAP